MNPGRKPGPAQRPLCCKVLEAQVIALRQLAEETGCTLNAYMRALIEAHLEEMGRTPPESRQK